MIHTKYTDIAAVKYISEMHLHNLVLFKKQKLAILVMITVAASIGTKNAIKKPKRTLHQNVAIYLIEKTEP